MVLELIVRQCSCSNKNRPLVSLIYVNGDLVTIVNGLDPMIYLDNAATTRLKKEALDAMMPFLTGDFANPSSVHKMARGPRNAVDEARGRIAKLINAQKGEIYFTSGGTESDNWAIKCGPRILLYLEHGLKKRCAQTYY